MSLTKFTQNADGSFSVVQDDGTSPSTLALSGLVLPDGTSGFPNVELWHLEVFESGAGKGMDVGCNYGRNGADGKWISKLTICRNARA